MIPGNRAIILTPSMRELTRLNKYLKENFPYINLIDAIALITYGDAACISVKKRHWWRCSYCSRSWYENSSGDFFNVDHPEFNFCTVDDFISLCENGGEIVAMQIDADEIFNLI